MTMTGAWCRSPPSLVKTTVTTWYLVTLGTCTWGVLPSACHPAQPVKDACVLPLHSVRGLRAHPTLGLVWLNLEIRYVQIHLPPAFWPQIPTRKPPSILCFSFYIFVTTQRGAISSLCLEILPGGSLLDSVSKSPG